MHKGVSAVMEGARLIQWANERNAENMARAPQGVDAIFEPPFTTLHVGTISGGTAHNITAADCEFVLAFRCVPGEPMSDWEARMRAAIAEIEAGMKAVHPEAGIEVEEIFDVPALKPEESGIAEAMVRAITGDNGTHVVSYGTEAGHFQAAGYSAVVCGPGSIDRAHQPDEFIETSQFEAGRAFLERLMDTLSQEQA